MATANRGFNEFSKAGIAVALAFLAALTAIGAAQNYFDVEDAAPYGVLAFIVVLLISVVINGLTGSHRRRKAEAKFANAVKDLSDQHAASRVAAIHRLWEVAQEHSSQKLAIIDVLSAFLQNSPADTKDAVDVKTAKQLLQTLKER